jgi:hypothetical protein
MYNKNCDKACTDLNVRLKRRWKYYATNLATKPSPRIGAPLTKERKQIQFPKRCVL